MQLSDVKKKKAILLKLQYSGNLVFLNILLFLTSQNSSSPAAKIYVLYLGTHCRVGF